MRREGWGWGREAGSGGRIAGGQAEPSTAFAGPAWAGEVSGSRQESRFPSELQEALGSCRLREAGSPVPFCSAGETRPRF